MQTPIRIAAIVATTLAFAFAQAADKRESRATGVFTGIGLSAPVDVHVTQGAATSVAVEGPEALVSLLETAVEGKSLRIRVPRDYRGHWNGKVKVHVTMPRVEALAIAGSGDIHAPAVTGDSLEVSVSGSGDVRLGGKVEGLAVSIAGSGDIRASDLEAATVSISIAGSGDATVRARRSLAVNIAGSGDVRYYGDPAVRKSILGSGSVRRLGAAAS